jgi:hypothetical protein
VFQLIAQTWWTATCVTWRIASKSMIFFTMFYRTESSSV